jgi:acyl-coenzyme A synthetase/AMP-(fatty) acid ligase/thioesterase domain-containing protein/acyl carrier protein
MVDAFSNFGTIEDIELGQRWDRERLRHEVHRRAGVLSNLGIGSGSVIAIAHGGSALFFADLLASWSIGATVVCLDSSLTPKETRNVIEFSKSAIVLLGRETALQSFPVPAVDLAGGDTCNRASIPSRTCDLRAFWNSDVPALILFTSGTTNVPKGVVLSYRAIAARIDANISAIGRDTLRRTLVTLPTYFGHGLIGNSLTPLFAGGDLILHQRGISLAKTLGHVIDKYRISFLSSTPTLWRVAIAHSEPPTGNTLARIHIGSAPLSAALWSQVAAWSRTDVVNCYGATEAANWIAGASSRTDGIADGLVGRMWGGVAAVMDESGEVQIAGNGEILVRSPSLMEGYLCRPDLTAAALVQRWLHTGDQGTIDAQGRIWLAGRTKDQISRSGIKIQPEELDLLLERHPNVEEACVFGIPDPISGEIIAAAVKVAARTNTTPEQLQAWCRERVRREAIPERWFFVARIPRNDRGKVSRTDVRRALVDMAPGADTTAVHMDASKPKSEDATHIRDAVEQAWSEVFTRETYATNSSIEDAGGDSVKTLRLWLLLEEALDVHLPLDFFEPQSTPSSIVAAIEQVRQNDGHTVPDTSHKRLAKVFFFPPANGDLPGLANFRAELKEKIRFSVIRYPGWREMTRAGANFDFLVDSAVAQIQSELGSAKGPCLLTGYSFGGFIAQAAATRLTKEGYRVDLVGLIDTRYTNAPRTRRNLRTRTRRFVSAITQHPHKVVGAVPRRIISALIWLSAYRALDHLAALAAILPRQAAIDFRLLLVSELRAKSLRHSLFEPSAVPTVLFRSQGYLTAPHDYGWSKLCSRLQVVAITGTHLTLFESTNREILCETFLRSVETALATLI